MDRPGGCPGQRVSGAPLLNPWSKSGRARVGTALSIVLSPRWWVEEVLAALIIGAIVAAGTIIGQKSVDDRRAEREIATALASNRHDLQLENLRFVRDRSSGQADESRRFAEFDLAGQNLVGLRLTGADFARADLSAANLAESNLVRSNLARADLRAANLARADLRGAYLGPERIPDAADQRGADLTDADLTGADLTGADLAGADLTGAALTDARLADVFYDAGTIWPQGFAAPPSRVVR